MKYFYLIIFSLTTGFCHSQNLGYLGRKNVLGVEINYHPLGGFYNNLNFQDTMKVNSSLTLRPSYEFAFRKGLSFVVDAGFKNIEVGKERIIKRDIDPIVEEEEKSILFWVDNSEDVSDTEEFENLQYVESSKFYISGFDVNLKAKFYKFKKEGKIAPIGKYFSVVLGLPFYKTYYPEDVSISYTQFLLGVEFGAQGIIKNYITYDFGFKSGYSLIFPPKLSDFYLYNFDDEYIPNNMFYKFSNMANFYFKIGYLL